MARGEKGLSRRARGAGMDLSTLQLIREKERELTDLIRAAKEEAETVVAAAQGKSESLAANAAAEAAAEAEVYLRGELVKVDREAEEIVARSSIEVEAVHRTSEKNMARARDLVEAYVIPECS